MGVTDPIRQDVVDFAELGTSAPVANINEIRVARINGVLMFSVDGSAYAAIGGGGAAFEVSYRARAATFLGTSNLDSWYMDFINGADDVAPVIVNSATFSSAVDDGVDAVNSIGGILRMTTASVAGVASSRFIPHIGTSFAPTCAFNTSSIRFYRACRFRMITTPTVDTVAWVGSQGFMAGVHGVNSLTKYSLRVKNSGSNFVTSTITIDTAFHVLESWHDGTKAWFSVDGETPIGLADVGLFPLTSTTQSFFEGNINRQAGTVDHQMDIDWCLWCVSPT